MIKLKSSHFKIEQSEHKSGNCQRFRKIVLPMSLSTQIIRIYIQNFTEIAGKIITPPGLFRT